MAATSDRNTNKLDRNMKALLSNKKAVLGAVQGNSKKKSKKKITACRTGSTDALRRFLKMTNPAPGILNIPFIFTI